jgi:hypothetical protein
MRENPREEKATNKERKKAGKPNLAGVTPGFLGS